MNIVKFAAECKNQRLNFWHPTCDILEKEHFSQSYYAWLPADVHFLIRPFTLSEEIIIENNVEISKLFYVSDNKKILHGPKLGKNIDTGEYCTALINKHNIVIGRALFPGKNNEICWVNMKYGRIDKFRTLANDCIIYGKFFRHKDRDAKQKYEEHHLIFLGQIYAKKIFNLICYSPKKEIIKHEVILRGNLKCKRFCVGNKKQITMVWDRKILLGRTEYIQNGDSFYDITICGSSKMWNNNYMIESTNYDNKGREHGIQRWWYSLSEGGHMKMCKRYKHGIAHGTFIKYGKNGGIVSIKKYKNGKPM